jgi:hypothetical protein
MFTISVPWALPTAIEFVPFGDVNPVLPIRGRCPRLLNSSPSGTSTAVVTDPWALPADIKFVPFGNVILCYRSVALPTAIQFVRYADVT